MQTEEVRRGEKTVKTPGVCLGLVLPRVPHALYFARKASIQQSQRAAMHAGEGRRVGRRGVTHEEDGPVFPCAVKDEEPHGSAEELGTEAVAHSW